MKVEINSNSHRWNYKIISSIRAGGGMGRRYEGR